MSSRDLVSKLSRRTLALASLVLSVAAPASAVGGLDGPNQPVGYVAGVPYAGGEYGGIDSVSPYSGALVLALPIGPGGFRVGPAGLGYSFQIFTRVTSGRIPRVRTRTRRAT